MTKFTKKSAVADYEKSNPQGSSIPTFFIDDGYSVPPRTVNLPDYGLMEVFARMLKGQSVLLRFADIPVDHARTYVQRFSRSETPKAQMITRAEKNADGDVIGLRVWRGD